MDAAPKKMVVLHNKSGDAAWFRWSELALETMSQSRQTKGKTR